MGAIGTIQIPNANISQTPNVSEGLAATLGLGVTNAAPNEVMFGDRTNGAGMFNGMDGLAARSRFYKTKQNDPGQYGIIGGVNLL